MSTFYTALQSARYSPKPPEPEMPIPEYLAQVAIGVELAEDRYDTGMRKLREWLATNPSTDDLSEMLPVFGDFFGYVF